MDRNDDDGAPNQPGVTSKHQNRRLTVRGNDRRRGESAVINDEATVLSRENFAAAREDAADLREEKATLREDAVHLREGAATSREQVICAAEATQAASDNLMAMLQQANAHLVIATIEAQKLAEQIRIVSSSAGKCQMRGGKSQPRQIGFPFQHEP
jgi:hypothetical protein